MLGLGSKTKLALGNWAGIYYVYVVRQISRDCQTQHRFVQNYIELDFTSSSEYFDRTSRGSPETDIP